MSRPSLFPEDIVGSEYYDKKIFYGLSPRELEERVWWRVERVGELNRDLYRLVGGERAYMIEHRHRQYGILSGIVMNYAMHHYIRMVRRGGVVAENAKRLLALFMMVFHWLVPGEVGKYIFDTGTSGRNLRCLMEELKNRCIDVYGPDSVDGVAHCVKELLSYEEYGFGDTGVGGELKRLIPHMVKRYRTGAGGARMPHDYMLDAMDIGFASTTPLASHVLSSIIRNYGYGEESGKRISVSGHLGVGKTTFVFMSLYATLRFIGVGRDDAVRYIHALLFNHPVELFMFVDLINQGVVDRVPFLVVDDVSSILSKYWIFEGREMKQAMIGFSKAIKIIRESVGVSVFVSDVSEAIAKGIRESIDVRIESEQVAPTGVAGQYYEISLWMDATTYRPVSVRGSGELRLSPSTADKISMLTGTSTPPFYIPDDVYRDLTAIKKMIRRHHMRGVRESIIAPIVKAISRAEQKEGGGDGG